MLREWLCVLLMQGANACCECREWLCMLLMQRVPTAVVLWGWICTGWSTCRMWWSRLDKRADRSMRRLWLR